MKKTTQWVLVASLAAAGAVGFACGGGNTESNPPNTGSASATETVTVVATVTPTASTATPVASTAPPMATPPPLVVSAMKLAVPGGKHTLEIKDDGSVLSDGKPAGKFIGAELQDSGGKTLMAVGADNVVKMQGASKALKFNDKDELEIDGGGKISVGDDGGVKLVLDGGKADKDSSKAKFTGFKPTARRAAVLVVAAMMTKSPMSLMPTPVTATPAATK